MLKDYHKFFFNNGDLKEMHRDEKQNIENKNRVAEALENNIN